MELKVTKEYSEILGLLEKLETSIHTELAVMRDEFKTKYSLDITRNILDYATDLIQMKLKILFTDAIKEFDCFTILMDCTETDLNLNEIEAIMRRVARQMRDSLPPEAAPEDIEVEIKQYLRTLIIRIPSRWTKPLIELFLQRFEATLVQLGVIIQ